MSHDKALYKSAHTTTTTTTTTTLSMPSDHLLRIDNQTRRRLHMLHSP